MDKSIEAAVERGNAAYLACVDDSEAFNTAIRAAIAAYRDAEIERLTASLVHWKRLADEACRGEMLALKEKHDLRTKLEASNKELREIAESINDPRVNLTMTVAEWCVEVQAKLEAVERDAARWRYWRKHHGWTGYFDDGASNSEVPEEIDAACDAARGGERG